MGDAATSPGAGEQAGTACKIILSLSSCDARGLVPGLSPQQGAHFAAKRVVSTPELDLALQKVPCTQPLLSPPAWVPGNWLFLPAPCL